MTATVRWPAFASIRPRVVSPQIGEVELEADAYYVAYRQHRAIPAGRLSDSGDGHGTSDSGTTGLPMDRRRIYLGVAEGLVKPLDGV